MMLKCESRGRTGRAGRRPVPRSAWLCLSLLLAALTVAAPAWADAKDAGARPKDRADSLRTILARVGAGEGAAVADIGAGRGRDSWVFAQVVGESGTVFSEEIFQKNVDAIKTQAEKKGLSQVRAVLGKADDPCLPADSVDVAYMHYVYHHMAKPRPMLRGIWRCLKPGGHFVVVDCHRGTLRDWVERSRREKKHFFIAETTVVREAREEGFAFVGCPDDCWHKKEPFVLIFQRPKGLGEPGRDPDAPEPLPTEQAARLVLPLRGEYQRPVFVALGDARQLMGPILRHASGKGLEIVLEDWATRKDERGPLPENVTLPSTFTEKGDPHLPPEPIDAVFFLDSYHLLFHGKALLARIHERLAPGGCVYVLDRKAEKPLPRREASHRRKIRPETVKREMAEAGFALWFEGPPPAGDRFLLVFGKADAGAVRPEEDPFVAGPQIPGPPDRWLRENGWRLRGLRTADGQVVPISAEDRRAMRNLASQAAGDGQIVNLPGRRLRLVFERSGEGYALTNGRSPAE